VILSLEPGFQTGASLRHRGPRWYLSVWRQRMAFPKLSSFVAKKKGPKAPPPVASSSSSSSPASGASGASSADPTASTSSPASSASSGSSSMPSSTSPAASPPAPMPPKAKGASNPLAKWVGRNKKAV
jgi:hypothetical protein